MDNLEANRRAKAAAFVAAYLIAIVGANLLVTWLGKIAVIPNAFLLIGLDLVTRDWLHEAWAGRRLWWRTAALVLSGSLLSYLVNHAAGRVAVASCLAFASAGIADTVVYHGLRRWGRLIAANGSNLPAALADSVVFPTVAFGSIDVALIAGQFAAKALGGALWAWVLWGRKMKHNDGEKAG